MKRKNKQAQPSKELKPLSHIPVVVVDTEESLQQFCLNFSSKVIVVDTEFIDEDRIQGDTVPEAVEDPEPEEGAPAEDEEDEEGDAETDETPELSQVPPSSEIPQPIRYSILADDTPLTLRSRLVTLQIQDPSALYVFDALALGNRIFESRVKEILENPEIQKIFHDSRRDFHLLYRNHGVYVKNIFDTQICHLYRFRQKSKRPSNLFRCGLSLLCTKYLAKHFDTKPLAKIKKETKERFSLGVSGLEERPIPPQVLEYMMLESVGLRQLSRKMSEHIEPPERMRIVETSQRYAELFVRMQDWGQPVSRRVCVSFNFGIFKKPPPTFPSLPHPSEASKVVVVSEEISTHQEENATV